MHRISRFLFLPVAGLLLSVAASAQVFTPEYKSYKWSDDPKLHTLSESDLKSNAIIILDERLIEYALEGDQAVMYTTRHVIVRANSDKAIEQYNRVYIQMTGVLDAVDVRGRAISKDGKVTNVTSDNIKTVDNYQNLGPFKIFAIDGIEKGGEVEYLYTLKKGFSRYGSEYIHADALHKTVRIDIWSPSHLVFDTKSYNGLPATQLDSTSNKDALATKRHLFVEAHDINGIDKEEYSAEDGAVQRLEYKFAYNTSADPNHRLNTWDNAAENIWSGVHVFTKTDLKKGKSLLKKIGVTGLSQEEQIRKIETWIKTNIVYREDLAPTGKDDKYESISSVIKGKLANTTGLMRLYFVLFDLAGIEHEIVITSDRFDKRFDGDFDSWTYLQHYLIYFNGTNGFVAPTEPANRYNFIPAEWSGQDGIFVRGVSARGVVVATGRVKEIPEMPYDASMNTIEANITFDLDMGSAKEHFKQSTIGYESSGLQPYYSFIPSDDDRKKIIDDIIKNYSGNSKPSNTKVSGYEEKDLYRNPFVIETDFTTNALLEKTGPKYLFKIGEVIGPQSQLYQADERKTPVDARFNHGYVRSIVFQIPDGYKVTNLDALNMDVFQEKDGKRTMEFHSSYKVEGSKVTVTVNENYRQLHFPVEQYEDFRKVINAAADFNKIVLFLEKQ